MFCPSCNSLKTRVLDKRSTEANSAIRRRRECLKCRGRFTTYERARPSLIVLKKNRKNEVYDLSKIRNGMLKAIEGRPINPKKFESIIEKIDNEIKSTGRVQIKSKVIGDIVTRELKKFDKVAYVRFMSFYKKYDNIKSFKKELGR